MRTRSNLLFGQGFTLVELIMVIVLLGILAAVGSNMLSDSFTTTRMVNANNASEAEARYAVERLAREIREVKRVAGTACISNPSTYPTVDTTYASQLVFDKTSDAACVTTGNTSINFAGADSTLRLNNAILASNVINTPSPSGLRFFQSNGTDLATSNDDVYFVEIRLSVKDDVSGQTITQTTRVALRNS